LIPLSMTPSSGSQPSLIQSFKTVSNHTDVLFFILFSIL
jgi:hypothetical protein